MSRTVLIVEDSDQCITTLEIAIQRMADVHVTSVASAEQALAFLADSEICALITDLNLPRMDGFELIACIRSRPGGSTLPIMVISGDSDPHAPERARRMGANAFFPKPYSPAEVRRKLEQLIDAI
jgi:two-component system, chemotaxis family, chemotaxis protein CheY